MKYHLEAEIQSDGELTDEEREAVVALLDSGGLLPGVDIGNVHLGPATPWDRDEEYAKRRLIEEAALRLLESVALWSSSYIETGPDGTQVVKVSSRLSDAILPELWSLARRFVEARGETP